jgi:hypothetical protein
MSKKENSLMKKALNEEQLLFIALHISSHSPIDRSSYPAFNYSEKLIVAYLMEKYGPDIAEKELEEKYLDLIADFILTEATDNGEIEVEFKNGKISYIEKGK